MVILTNTNNKNETKGSPILASHNPDQASNETKKDRTKKRS
jgi:hypothetical protein